MKTLTALMINALGVSSVDNNASSQVLAIAINIVLLGSPVSQSLKLAQVVYLMNHVPQQHAITPYSLVEKDASMMDTVMRQLKHVTTDI